MITRSEKGAVGTIVGVLLATGMVFGFLAISVDVGGLLWERRQLQNAADAAALSLAADCGKGTNCASAGELSRYANSNSSDGLSTVLAACATNLPNSGLPPCGAPATTSLTQCPALPPAMAAMAGLPYVEVRTQSLSSNGGFVSNWFAGVSGGGGSATSTVAACARAAVGAPGSGSGDIPIAFSACDWRAATGGNNGGGGGTFYPPPVYNGSTVEGYDGANQPPWPAEAGSPPVAGVAQEVILLSANPSNNNGNGNTSGAPTCPDWNGHPLPGGFGTLETTSDPCELVEYPHHWMHTSPGNNVSCNLDALVGTVVRLPIFDCTALNPGDVAPPIGDCTGGQGNGAYYHRAGYASFYLSGYQINIPGNTTNKRKSLVSGQFPCTGGDRCISGWFVTGSLASTSISGPPSGGGYFGTFGVVPAG